MGLIRLLFRWLICSLPDDANQEEDKMEHRCIIGVIASPEGLMIGYQGDERLMSTYGGMEFEYCPICGQPNTEAKATVIEFDDGAHAVKVGNRFYTDRIGG